MELLYSRALDMNGSNIEDDDGMEPTIYKQKYERAMKELEYLKQRLQQQHEDDLEQLMALKKQLEKKVFFFVSCFKNILRTYSVVLSPQIFFKCMFSCYIKKSKNETFRARQDSNLQSSVP